MRDAAGQAVVGGRSRERCVLMDVDAQKIPLTWAAAESAGEAGESTLRDGDVVSLRFFYRDATIFAVGMEPEPVQLKVDDDESSSQALVDADTQEAGSCSVASTTTTTGRRQVTLNVSDAYLVLNDVSSIQTQTFGVTAYEGGNLFDCPDPDVCSTGCQTSAVHSTCCQTPQRSETCAGTAWLREWGVHSIGAVTPISWFLPPNTNMTEAIWPVAQQPIPVGKLATQHPSRRGHSVPVSRRRL